MTARKVIIIFNDDGHDTYKIDGKLVDLDNNLFSTVADIEGGLKARGFSTSLLPLRNASGLEGFTKAISSARDSLIFNLCEGAFSKSAFEMNVAALLELYGARFTGSPPLALGLALDKGVAKDILRSRGIPTPEYAVMERAPAALPCGLEFPLIVKPLREDASVGIDANAVVSSLEALKSRVDFITKRYSQPVIVEEYIDGREFNIAVLGNGADKKALPPSEILFVDFPEGQPKICCYEAKWVEESPLFRKTVPSCPAKVPEALRDELQAIALKAYGIIGCRDYARVDMRVGHDGKIKVLEVNPNPDISSDAGFARAAKASGLEYPDLVASIVGAAEARYQSSEVQAKAPVPAV
jgi:D-alanine-D-alanine ligase